MRYAEQREQLAFDRSKDALREQTRNLRVWMWVFTGK